MKSISVVAKSIGSCSTETLGIATTFTMKTLSIIAAILAATTLGCSATNIRVRNDSNLDFKDVIVGDKKYGDIKHGQATEYQPWNQAYRYAFVSLLAASKPKKIQPIDFVGEKFLGEGKFTYVLTIKDDRLQIHAEQDAK